MHAQNVQIGEGAPWLYDREKSERSNTPNAR